MSDITPVAWALYNSREPEFNEVEFAYPYREPITEDDMKAGWTATPLFTREQAAAEERAKIVAWLRKMLKVAALWTVEPGTTIAEIRAALEGKHESRS